ncbi:MAG: hypothetical protein HOV79_15635 [Hamadaea sp.]|nr:hypothetical protein [Hamadaea sp.]
MLWFCKSGYRRYDLAVTAILLRCRMLAPGDFRIASDGTWDDWDTPIADCMPSTRRLTADLFGPLPDRPFGRI